MSASIRSRLLFFALAGVLASSAQAAQFPEMLRRVPGDTNVLVMVDVDRLLDSPLAKERGWKEKVTKNSAQRPLLLPPSAHKMMRAITIDLSTQSPASEITLLEAAKGLSLDTIAKRQKGYVEEIANVKSVWLPKGGYCVKLTDELFGVLFPSNRQLLSRWIRDKSGQASTYLADSAREMKPKGPQVVVAIDLEDLIEPGSLEERLADSKSLGQSQDKLKSMAGTLAGVRGARLAVTFDKEATGQITVHFDGDVAALAPVAKPLMLEVLGNRGLALDELDDWKAAATGRQLTLSGSFTDSGLMRLSSLLELPSDLIDDPEEDVDADNPALYATQAYYKKVQALLEDLFSKKKQSFGQYAQWAEQYAQKIDRLPLVNVDQEMQEYGTGISELLRGGAVAFKGVGIRSGYRQREVWNSNYYGYNSYGSSYGATAEQKNAIRGQEAAVGATDAAEMKRQIDQASAAIRKVMVDRYQVEF